jgi:hypothetical protein
MLFCITYMVTTQECCNIEKFVATTHNMASVSVHVQINQFIWTEASLWRDTNAYIKFMK